MSKTIAVDDELTNIRQYLEERGFRVVSPAQGFKEVEALVVAGLDTNYLGDQTLAAAAPVIEAKGLTAEEVWRKIEERSV
ncbi:MAG: YkuS family protein [Firmicutes bacterium]|nr:YkuS family protein [Bacillota bacterium]